MEEIDQGYNFEEGVRGKMKGERASCASIYNLLRYFIQSKY
jgi:hypothetical protein